MAKKDLKISELKKLKKKLDDDIFKLIKDFEKETGVSVDYIDFERKWSDEGCIPAPSTRITGVTTTFDRSLLE